MIFPSYTGFDEGFDSCMVVVDIPTKGILLIWTNPMPEKIANSYLKRFKREFENSVEDIRFRLIHIVDLYDASKDLSSLSY